MNGQFAVIRFPQAALVGSHGAGAKAIRAALSNRAVQLSAAEWGANNEVEVVVGTNLNPVRLSAMTDN
jgi:hypothetical protein